MSAFLCIAVILSLSLLTLATDGKFGALFIIVTAAVCCLNTAFGFCSDEKRALSFTEKYKAAPDTVFCGEILSSSSYSSYTQADLVITLINGEKADFPYKCRVGFYSGESLTEGDTVFFKGTPQYPQNDDSTSFDTVSYLRSRKIFTVFPSIEIISSHAAKKLSPISKIRLFTKRTVYRHILPQCAAVAYCMLSGDSGHLDKEIKEDFTRSGIIHVLCVSGMHFSILMGALYGFLKLFSIRKQTKLFVMTGFCVFYLIFTGFPVSGVRACIICVIGYCASLLGRTADGYNSLFAAMVLIALFSPESVLDISAQLSFFATFGIITATQHFAWVPKKRSLLIKLAASTVNLLIANLGAVMFTFAVSSASFGGISVIGILATALISFACEALLICLCLLILLSPISFLLQLHQLLAGICNILSAFIIKCADFFSSLRFSYVDTDFTYITLILFITTLVICVLFVYMSMEKAVVFSVFCILMLCFGVTVLSLSNAIIRDSRYSISYFRQNENNRQLTVKLGSCGYLIINADSELCTNPSKAVFDCENGSNYLLIIPDESTISPSALAENISDFDKLYGIRRVFIPSSDSDESLKVSQALSKVGIEPYYMPSSLDFGTFKLSFEFLPDGVFITVCDKSTTSQILFADSYSPSYYSDDCQTGAYFTRKTANQFNLQSDTLPPCDIFFTRLKKGEAHEKIHNTYGESSFYIKE